MLDLRIYRLAFVPVLIAVVVLMFSLDPAPPQLQGPVSTPAFEASSAARLARTITELAPDRTPGSAGDEASAKFVRERLSGVEGGELAEQPFEMDVNDETVNTSNVVLTIPGASEQVLLVIAPRDTVAGDGATTSAAATGSLLTLAEALGSSRHQRTIVLASTSGSEDGEKGVRDLVGSLDAPEGISAAIVIGDPGVAKRVKPFVVAGRAGPDSPPPVLLDTAGAIATTQFGEKAIPAGFWSGFSRLVFPAGVGPSAALADEGVSALTVTPTGERPPSPETASGAEISADNLFATGTSVLNLLLTLDDTDRPVQPGEENYVRLGDNVIPGWTFELLALTLLLPSLLAGIDIWFRDRRRNRRAVRRSIPWTLERVFIPLAALIGVYMLGLFGLIPSPSFPYDPGQLVAGARFPITFALLALLMVGVAVLVRPMRTPLDSEPQTLGAAAGILACVSIFGIWLINPYMALLATPAAHVWVVTARPQGPPRPLLVALGGLLSLALLFAAFIQVGSALGLGVAAPWHLLVLTVDGQVNPFIALAWCGLVGALIACVGACRAQPAGIPGTSAAPRQRLRGPSGYAGPGSLGGTPSGASRRR